MEEHQMSDSADESGQAESPQKPPTVSIAVPYAISNMVFLQAAPLWLCVVGGTAGVLIGTVKLLRGGEAHATVIALGCVTAVATVALAVLWNALWRRALQGRSAAIGVVYGLHVLLVCGLPLILPMAAFVFGPVAMQGLPRGNGGPAHGPSAAFALGGLVCLLVFGVIWITAIVNLFERGFWQFAALDGLCPACRKWRFGRIKVPSTVRCAHCGAELEFCRRGQERAHREVEPFLPPKI
jgi:hypothetical protein